MLGRGKSKVQAETGHVVGLDDVTFSVERGEIFVVMGLSGSGKSTAIRTVNKLHGITAGSVTVGGVDVQALSGRELQSFRRERMGMVFQNFALFPHRDVIKNVCYGLKVQGFSKRARESKGMSALELVGLSAYATSKPSELSGGMQQRVGLARALAADPDILLMDEAFSALDPLIRRQMQDEIARYPAGASQDDPVHHARSQRGTAHRGSRVHHERRRCGADRHARGDTHPARHKLRSRVRTRCGPGSCDTSARCDAITPRQSASPLLRLQRLLPVVAGIVFSQ